jgi:hypothetical protein
MAGNAVGCRRAPYAASARAGERTGAVNPFTRIALEAAVLILGLIVFSIFMAYLLGAFSGSGS